MAKKKVQADRSLTELRGFVDFSNRRLSVRRQCDLLGINRSGLYYRSKGESAENLRLMELIDKEHLSHPTHGVLQIQDFLKRQGHQVNVKRVRRLMQVMAICVQYCKRNLSKLGDAVYIHPYLLRNLEVTRRNQVWQIDITYIPVSNGFMYLTAIIDVYSRYVVGWDLHNTLQSENVLSVLKQAIAAHGAPEIMNSDQGRQFTCLSWIEEVNKHGIRISMDGKGRALDNIYIERFWRTIKYDYIYLNPCQGLQMYHGIKAFIRYYNNEKGHQGIGFQTPKEVYLKPCA